MEIGYLNNAGSQNDNHFGNNGNQSGQSSSPSFAGQQVLPLNIPAWNIPPGQQSFPPGSGQPVLPFNTPGNDGMNHYTMNAGSQLIPVPQHPYPFIADQSYSAYNHRAQQLTPMQNFPNYPTNAADPRLNYQPYQQYPQQNAYRRKRSGYLVRMRTEARDFTQFLFEMSKKCSYIASQSQNTNRFGFQNHMGYGQQFVSGMPNNYDSFYPEGEHFSGLQSTGHHANNMYNFNQFGVDRAPLAVPRTGSAASYPGLTSVNSSGAPVVCSGTPGAEVRNSCFGAPVVRLTTGPVATTSSTSVASDTSESTGLPVTSTYHTPGLLATTSSANMFYPSQTPEANVRISLLPGYNYNKFGVNRATLTVQGTQSAASYPAITSVNSSGAPVLCSSTAGAEVRNSWFGAPVVRLTTGPVATTSSMSVTSDTSGSTGSSVTSTSNALGSLATASPAMYTVATSLYNGARMSRVTATSSLRPPYSFPSHLMLPNNYGYEVAPTINDKNIQSNNYNNYTGNMQLSRSVPPSGSSNVHFVSFGLNNQFPKASAANTFHNTSCEYDSSLNNLALSSKVTATTVQLQNALSTGISTTANNTTTSEIIVTTTAAQTTDTVT